MSEPHLFVSTLAGAGRIDVDHAECIDRLKSACAVKGWGCTVARAKGGGVERNRNLHAAHFLTRTACSHYVSIDSGVVFDERDVMRMVDSGLHVVGAAPPGKDIDWNRVGDAARAGAPNSVLRWLASDAMVSASEEQWATPPERTPHGRFLAVNGVSTAYMIVDRESLGDFVDHYRDRIEYSTDPGFDAGHSKLWMVFHHQRDPECDTPAGGYKGEDFAFCQLWRMMGGRVWCAVDATVIQNGSHPYCMQLGKLLPTEPTSTARALFQPRDH